MFAFPIIGALLIAISRTRDYRHHWQDVTIGAILGTLCAYFAYRQFYPGLSHNSCHDPFLARLARLKRFDEELAQHLHHPSTAAYDQSSLLHSESTSSRTKYQMEDDMTLHNDIPLAPK
jgi:diacylglycerol diphosphate phosphatase/phosphatidate phosphatase